MRNEVVVVAGKSGGKTPVTLINPSFSRSGPFALSSCTPSLYTHPEPLSLYIHICTTSLFIPLPPFHPTILFFVYPTPALYYVCNYTKLEAAESRGRSCSSLTLLPHALIHPQPTLLHHHFRTLNYPRVTTPWFISSDLVSTSFSAKTEFDREVGLEN